MAYEGDFGGTLAPFWGYFGATLGIWTSNGRYDGCSCEFDGVIVRPKRVHKQEIQICRRFLLVKEAWSIPTVKEQAEPDRPGGQV